MSEIAVITTFPNSAWNIYAKQMLQSFVRHWPLEIRLFAQLDDDLLLRDVKSLLRDIDLIGVDWPPEHTAFVERNRGRDDGKSYRKQAVRFCHKVFAIANVLEAIRDLKSRGEKVPRFLIWMDADVHTIRPVSVEDIKECLPKEGDAVSYMGRKDWDHSECGWLAFDLENGGDLIIDLVMAKYLDDSLFNEQQWHDSWIFDRIREYCSPANQTGRWTNLTPHANGMDVWPQSPMGKWSVHYKGPQAKANLAMKKQPQNAPSAMQRVIVQTKNAIPDADIRAQIAKNQTLIKNWIRPCATTDEKAIVVSAGPLLVAEDVRKDAFNGNKIIAVKHALTPLKQAGITPWACILLDPRPHVADFVQDADPSIIWFVASQVNPVVTLHLLARGCRVFGYHAAVGAGEQDLIGKQIQAVVSGGSATATRGLFVLSHLGFSSMKLYGYDLSLPDKPDFNETVDMKDDQGNVLKQPKYMELNVSTNDPLHNVKRCFWTEPQFVAQFEELNEIIKNGRFNLEAEGDGVIPFMIRAKQIADMRRKEMHDKIIGDNPPTYLEMIEAA